MKTLEKILEEIKISSVYAETADKFGAMCVSVGTIERIIRKHMNDKAADDGWIPVEERLPENGESVLCTDGEYIYLVEYDADLDAAFGDMDRIIAWQPLPEPYSPERNGE